MKYTENSLEQAAIEWFQEKGYSCAYGPDIEPGSEKPEREKYSDVVLAGRLRLAIEKLNPSIPVEAREEALKKVVNVPLESSLLRSNNNIFHRMLVNGVDVEYKRTDRSIAGDKVWLVDREKPGNNDFLVVNQFTVIESDSSRLGLNNNGEEFVGTRRPDVVVFVNGLPVAIFELKNLADENVGIRDAFNQIQTYKSELPSLFSFNELCVISDGAEAKVGSLTADWDRYMRWRSIDGSEVASNAIPQLEVLIKGLFEKTRLIDFLLNFITFQKVKEDLVKIVAAYHQYFAVNKAVESTVKATSEKGDKRAGVVWHTQGSGKSLTMVFYSGKLVQKLDNPTLVILTDRNDLDQQLFDTFSANKDLLRQKPEQAINRNHLRSLLKVSSGGVVFTTIQKFLQKGWMEKMLLTDRRNVVVIADEAHRSQYDFIDGYARHMREALPNASFIGFTGTPVELTDRDTKAVFGDYVDVYDIAQAVEDHATVPIYYEARLAKIELLESEKPRLDIDFDDITEGEENEFKDKLKNKWSRLEAMVGSEKRIKLVAKDIVEHFKNRLDVMEGKAMIVVMSRRIAVELYDEIIKLRPDWHSENDKAGTIKVIMTGSASDPPNFQKHIRHKIALGELADRMKDPKDELKIVIVRDMWLTGFDAPCMHTMYIDKPMKGHGLMQAIARVNRVYKDKPAGLVVDYLGIAPQLKEALSNYTDADQGEVGVDQEKAVSLVLEKYEIAKAMFHGYNYAKYFELSEGKRTSFIGQAADFILGFDDGEKRYRKAIVELSKAFALAVPHEKALEIRDDVGFFQVVKAYLNKSIVQSGPTEEDYDLAIKQIVSGAIASNEVIDVFSAAGLENPNVAILSDEFLEEVRGLGKEHLALELLRKMLNDQLKIMGKRNVLASRKFSEMLEQTIKAYQNRTIEAAQVITELINLAKDIRKETEKGKETGLSDEEIAFYDALADNESAIKELGDKTLRLIAKELVDLMRNNTSIMWTSREDVRARIRIYIKKLLKKYNYPPDQQETATQLVLLQAEAVCRDWAGAD